ncbi:ABC transporter permease [Alicyclobacillus cellulosilyticus]|uniref:ABC transporter permease n=1 Tax=Alicyclobacillus cellulosilyticus TaxID=1003997 RepID=A0A917K390_9BACL|nr:carbohydrate ABC transporter permease [Alicyclobacillus cellulosilyticus]GGI95302.1 ABC transporter permease [Alicyclobacillus cellulosilyticus]
MWRHASRAAFHAVMWVISAFMLYPILWTLASSLKPESEIFTHAASLIPSHIDWSNYTKGWIGFGDVGFARFFANSFFITFMVLIGTLLSSPWVAYGFSRLRFPLRNTLFVCLMVSMMLPAQVTVIPQYILFRHLGWVNTYYPLIVPAYLGGSAFFVFLIMQFIRTIPRELDEAAKIDGCGPYRIYTQVIFPLCAPVLVTVAIFAFYWTWDDFFGPLIYLNNTHLYTVSIGLSLFSSADVGTNWGPMFAMSVLSLLPVLIVFLFFQRYIVEGVTMGSLKA